MTQSGFLVVKQYLRCVYSFDEHFISSKFALLIGWFDRAGSSTSADCPGCPETRCVTDPLYIFAKRSNSTVPCSLGVYTPSAEPHLLWVTEFPLFTRADNDKDFLAKGRWSSSHHPFTAPMWQDVEKLFNGDIASVCISFPSHSQTC